MDRYDNRATGRNLPMRIATQEQSGTMDSSPAAEAVTIAKKINRVAVATVKPLAKAVVSVVTRHPEMIAAGSFGYLVGDRIDRSWPLGYLTGGNAKYLCAFVGAAWGYQLALSRRRLDQREESLSACGLHP